jgi:hypothetical protein
MPGWVVAQYGDGHWSAIAFHCSGVRPVQTETERLPLGAIDVIADAARHVVWPRTGRLATVNSTGAAASPPRRRRRRSPDRGRSRVGSLPISGDLSGSIREIQSKRHSTPRAGAAPPPKTTACRRRDHVQVF